MRRTRADRPPRNLHDRILWEAAQRRRSDPLRASGWMGQAGAPVSATPAIRLPSGRLFEGFRPGNGKLSGAELRERHMSDPARWFRELELTSPGLAEEVRTGTTAVATTAQNFGTDHSVHPFIEPRSGTAMVCVVVHDGTLYFLGRDANAASEPLPPRAPGDRFLPARFPTRPDDPAEVAQIAHAPSYAEAKRLWRSANFKYHPDPNADGRGELVKRLLTARAWAAVRFNEADSTQEGLVDELLGEGLGDREPPPPPPPSQAPAEKKDRYERVMSFLFGS